MNKRMPRSGSYSDYLPQRCHDAPQFHLLLLDRCSLNFCIDGITVPPSTNIGCSRSSFFQKLDARSEAGQQRSCMNDAPIGGVDFPILRFPKNMLETVIGS